MVEIGDELEVRGPIGGWFVWDGDTPALLVGGGSGIVPLMAMLRLARTTGRRDLVRLVVSVRSPGDLYYASEVGGAGDDDRLHAHRAAGSARPAGRLAPDDVAPLITADATVYVCGSPGFADAASDLLVGLDVPVERIRVERFGPTG